MKPQRSFGFPYLRYGILAGAIGASVVAFFFLSRPPDLALIAGYTAIHGVVFVAFASIIAVVLLGTRNPPTSEVAQLGVLSAALFLASTAIFYAFSTVWTISSMDSWRVLGANLLASVAMAVPLARLWRPSRATSGRRCPAPRADRSGNDLPGGRGRARTADPLGVSEVLFQLSYAPARVDRGGETSSLPPGSEARWSAA